VTKLFSLVTLTTEQVHADMTDLFTEQVKDVLSTKGK